MMRQWLFLLLVGLLTQKLQAASDDNFECSSERPVLPIFLAFDDHQQVQYRDYRFEFSGTYEAAAEVALTEDIKNYLEDLHWTSQNIKSIQEIRVQTFYKPKLALYRVEYIGQSSAVFLLVDYETKVAYRCVISNSVTSKPNGSR